MRLMGRRSGDGRGKVSVARWAAAVASVGALIGMATLVVPVAMASTVPTISTQLSSSTYVLGSSSPGVTDTVTVAGEPDSVTDKNVYVHVYKGSATGPQAAEWEVPLSSAGTATTPAWLPQTVGTFCFEASFTGSAADLQANGGTPLQSACENLTVSVNASISTQLSSDTYVLGSGAAGVTDTVTVTGEPDVAGYNAYVHVTNESTGSAADAWEILLSAAGTATTPAFVPKTADTYCFMASFTGPSTVDSPVATGSCETLTVSPASPPPSGPSISTQLSTGTLTLNTPITDPGGVTDTVTVTGEPVVAGYMVYLHLYQATGNPPAPTGSSISTWEAPLNADGVATIPATGIPFVPESAGTFCFVATFTGSAADLLANGGNPLTSSCELLTVNKFAASLTTTPVTPTSGSNLADTAVMTMYPLKPASNGSGDFGSVDFTLYSDPACSDPVSGGSVSALIGYTNGEMEATGTLSFSAAPLAAGTYYWMATYAGNYDNLAFTSSCGEPTTVQGSGTSGAQTPSITTQLSSNSITTGQTAYDTAKLANVSSGAGGTVTYSVFNNDSCSSSATATDTVTVTNGVVPDSTDVTFADAGTYYWQADYSGDGNNSGATSACTSEPLVVTSSPAGGVSAASTPTPTTGADLGGPGLIAGICVALGLLMLAGAALSRRLRPLA